MVDFIAKLRDLEEKIVDEFSTLEIDFSLDNLLFNIKYQIRENESHNTDTLIKSQMLNILKDLKQKIMCEFHTYYNNNNNDQIDHLSTILFKIKYQIDEIENDILLSEKDDDSNSFRNIETSKATAIRRMQILANLIACRIINLNNDL